jgi:pterin-4a-carbinolamine dehydratase/uncharacterized protein (DUF2267 family)
VNIVLKHREFLEEVAIRAAADDTDQAERMAESVVAGVARCLDEPGRERLVAVLPSSMTDVVAMAARHVEQSGLAPFLATVASATDTSPERARYVAQATLSLIAADDPDAAAVIRGRLPDDMDELFEAPGDGPPPEPLASAAMPGPAELTAEEVDRVLDRLPGWTGDDRRLRRTVGLPPDLDVSIREDIARAEQELNHHARVEDGPDGTTFVLWTHSVGVVTDLDVQLALRINDAIDGSE